MRWIVAALVTAVVAATAIAVLYRHSASFELPLLIQPLRSKGRWTAFGGTWVFTDQAIENISDERGAKLVMGSHYWKDYVIDADVELDGDSGDAGLLGRVQDPDEGVDAFSGVYAGLRFHDNALIAGQADYGWAELPSQRLSIQLEPYIWYHLRLEAVGCHFKIAATTEAGVIIGRIDADLHDCNLQGQIGLRSYRSGGRWEKDQDSEGGAALMIAGGFDVCRRGAAVLLFALSAIAATAENSSQSYMSIADLRTWLGGPDKMVSVRGVVTRLGQDSFLQDSSAGVMVKFRTPPRLKVGDEVVTMGYPHQMAYGTYLSDATARVLWGAAPPPPLAINAGQAARGDFDNQFVEIVATLKSIGKHNDSESILHAAADGQEFNAILENENRGLALPELQVGSMVRLRGICSMDLRLTRNEMPFVLLMRSGDDAEKLADPPWYTPSLLLRDLLIACCTLSFSWIVLIRLRAHRENALQEEREHIAHEMHDTLAQSFAGVAFQLEAVRSNLNSRNAQINDQLEVAMNMVRYSHLEARRTIATLQRRGVPHPTIAEEIEESVQRMIGHGPLAFEINVTDPAVSLPLRIANGLVRVAQEATANAIHHSSASRLKVDLVYSRDAVRLRVEDNGLGFDVVAVKHQPGFGLIGMETRMKRLNGTFEVTSRRGEGTVVAVAVPMPPHRRWRFLRSARHAHTK